MLMFVQPRSTSKSSDDDESLTDKYVLPSNLPVTSHLDCQNDQGNPVPLRRSILWKQSATGCTFCDHKISDECSEMRLRGSNLPDAKCPPCLICSLTAVIFSFITTHEWNKPFKMIGDLHCMSKYLNKKQTT